MARFIAVPEDWSAFEAEEYQRKLGADGFVWGAPVWAPKEDLPFCWDEDSVLGEKPEIAESFKDITRIMEDDK